jgi:hypothetical protein
LNAKRFALVVAALALFVSASAGFAEPVAVGTPMKPYTLPDQFGEQHTLAPATRFVLIASEKDISRAINEWLSSKGEGYLQDHNLEYVSDIAPMPAPITKLFALPQMRKLNFKIRLNRDDHFHKDYPREKGKVALFLLDAKHTVTAIHFLEKPEEIAAMIE